MQKLTKKLTAVTLALLMVFSMATVMLHSLAESTASSTPLDSSSSSSVEPKSSSSSEESSSSEDSLVSSSSSLPDDSSSSVSSSKPADVNPNKTSYLKKATETYEVKFDTNGSLDQPDPQIIEAGGTVTEPAPPIKVDCQFAGWFSDKGLTQKFDFYTPIFSNMTIYAGYDIEVNETTFPDANFRNFVKTTYCNGGDILTQDTINATTSINCGGLDISNLKGIEYFTSLTKLNCWNNKLTELNLSSNTALTYLYCNNNQLTSLDVSGCTDLKELYCFGNKLPSLDVSHNTALTTLYCYVNQLTSLDLSHNTALTMLSCHDNNLTSLDLSKNTALTDLDCYNNQLTSLDVSKNTALTYLNCSSNQLKSLDVSKNTALTYLNCHHNQLTSLDLSNNTALTYLNCADNQLKSLDTSGLTLNYFNGNSQTPTAKAKCDKRADGHYVVDMKQIVGANNISNVENVSQGTMGTNGVIDFGETKPSEDKFSYNYDTNPPDNTRLLKVTLNLEYYDEITFEFKYADGNTASDSQLVTVGDQITLSDPTQSSQCGTYNGKWYKDAGLTQEVTSPYTVEEDVTTLYAGTTNKVTFDINGGTSDPPADQGILYGHKIDQKPADPTKPGLDFINWYRAPELTQVFDFNTPIKGDITLYAKYGVKINETNFPDKSFRDYLLDKTPCSTEGNIKYYTEAQIADIKEINLYNYGEHNVKNIKGIERFTNLEMLNCGWNQIEELDVKSNKALKKLQCFDNKITDLDVSGLENLEELECTFNFSLGQGTIETLNISGCSSLKKLNCMNNKLKNLDLSSNANLQIVNCSYNSLSNLILNGCSALVNLDCQHNLVESLDVSSNYNLKTLNCQENRNNGTKLLSEIKGLDQINLKELSCGGNSLTNLNIANNTNLEYLSCYGNELSKLDVSDLKNLVHLNCYYNHLTSLNTNGLTELTNFNGGYQISTAKCIRKEDGHYVVDMKDIVGANNISNVENISPEPIGYDNGIIDFGKNKPSGDKFSYYYDTNPPDSTRLLNVTLNLEYYDGITLEFKYADGSTASDSQLVTVGDPITLSEPTQSSQCGTYNGKWYKDAELTQEVTNPYTVEAGVTTLYAGTTNKVTFDLNGGTSPQPADQDVLYNHTATKPDDPTKEGFTFAGWFTDENLTQAFDFNTPITQNITLYAKYNENKVDPSSDDSKVEPTNTNGNDQNSGNNAAAKSTTGQDFTLLWACLLTSLISVLSIGEILYHRKKYQK